MGLLLLIPGIILANTSGWFHDQHKVGSILIICGAIILAIQAALWIAGLVGVAKASKDIRSRRW